MNCSHPFHAFPTGAYKDNGLPVIYLDLHRREFLLGEDFAKAGYDYKGCPGTRFDEYFDVPCGTCFGCKKDRGRKWSNRVMAESVLHDYCYFLTLTYDDDHNPGVLRKEDIVLFHKRLRKHFPFRFFLAGEYGSDLKTARPHYHEVVFMDQPWPDLRYWSKKGNSVYFVSDLLASVWPFGFHLIGKGCSSAVGLYVSSYLTKGTIKGDEFQLMSRRPGLGDDLYLRMYEKGIRSFSAPDGSGNVVKITIPRYFIQKTDLCLDQDFKDKCIVMAQNREFAEVLASGRDLDIRSIEEFREFKENLLKMPLNRHLN